MSRTDLSSKSCSIARAVASVGDEWTIMIVREMFLGSRRFDEFLRQTGMSSHLLAQRLKKLEKQGVIRREPYSKHPPRDEYRLTAMGRELWPVVIALKQWGDRWLGEGEPAVQIVHKNCGQITQPQMICSECKAPMTAHDAEARLSTSFKRERQVARRNA